MGCIYCKSTEKHKPLMNNLMKYSRFKRSKNLALNVNGTPMKYRPEKKFSNVF